ncbi:Uncharacterised protein [Metamycoplasma arthritidis]|uniref:Lipoprotein n=1 Tax=Metamycoplasma arthritidis (strain 158L3-1) TaxID=243272 RepID=B3PNE1_META1|nr:hypothetical protein [Metamycoplasma arthritidis]ACF07543.1 hypothetical protein MARTH_orf811 [Metamycoplasma arthritidis 158L3-1]VEU79051.1 Uncharacterised protein [Metamycoplasma arthritidis]
MKKLTLSVLMSITIFPFFSLVSCKNEAKETKLIEKFFNSAFKYKITKIDKNNTDYFKVGDILFEHIPNKKIEETLKSTYRIQNSLSEKVYLDVLLKNIIERILEKEHKYIGKYSLQDSKTSLKFLLDSTGSWITLTRGGGVAPGVRITVIKEDQIVNRETKITMYPKFSIDNNNAIVQISTSRNWFNLTLERIK